MRSVGSGRSPVISVRSTVSSIALEPFAHARDRGAREAHVLRDGEVRQQRRVLVDRGESDRRAPSGEPIRMSLPLSWIVPESWRMTPVRIFTSVLLPAPLAPSSAWTSPGSTTRSADLSATTGP